MSSIRTDCKTPNRSEMSKMYKEAQDKIFKLIRKGEKMKMLSDYKVNDIIDYLDNEGDWLNDCRFVHYDEHNDCAVIADGSEYIPIYDVNNIRPASTICDKAKDKIIHASLNCVTHSKYKVKVDCRDEMNDIFNLNTSGIFIHTSYDADPLSEKRFEELNIPELNLKTGEVIPVENKDIMKQTRKDVEFLHSQLKEKDAEIERLNKSLNFNRAIIDGYEGICKSFNKFKADLIEREKERL